MLTFKTVEKDKMQILTWDKAKFIDKNSDFEERPIRKLSLEIEAGNIAVITIERYNEYDEEKKDYTTFKERYAVEDPEGNLIINVGKKLS